MQCWICIQLYVRLFKNLKMAPKFFFENHAMKKWTENLNHRMDVE